MIKAMTAISNIRFIFQPLLNFQGNHYRFYFNRCQNFSPLLPLLLGERESLPAGRQGYNASLMKHYFGGTFLEAVSGIWMDDREKT